jgi:regulator of sigma E protease
MEGFFQTTFNVIFVLLGIALLLFIHELGHFLIAKKNGVRVEVFSLGFGPPLIRFSWGTTQYRLSLIPFGGYVRMAGESPVEGFTGAPDEFQSKPPLRRMEILFAGVLANFLLSFPLAIGGFLWGKYESRPVIGVPAPAEYRAGVGPGDEILELDGIKIKSLEHYIREVVGKPIGKSMQVKVKRDGKILKMEVIHRSVEFHRSRPITTLIAQVREKSPAWQGGLRPADRIISIEGIKVYSASEISRIIMENPQKDLRFVVERNGKKITLSVRPQKIRLFEFPQDYHLVEPVVGEVIRDYPADGVLLRGDRIERIAGRRIRSWHDLRETVKGLGGRLVKILLVRGGRKVELELGVGRDYKGEGFLGIRPAKRSTIGAVPKDSFYFRAGLREGDCIVALDGKRKELSVEEIFMRSPAEEKKPLEIELRRGKRLLKLTLQPLQRFYGQPIGIALSTPMVLKKEGFFRAIVLGVEEIFELGALTIKFLYKLIVREESPKNIAGPVGIFQISIYGLKLGLGNFLWLLALLCVGLAIFNILPIPVLDGGHMLLILVELLRGRRPSPKFVATFQYMGLVLILGLIMYVTYTDIQRAIFGR